MCPGSTLAYLRYVRESSHSAPRLYAVVQQRGGASSSPTLLWELFPHLHLVALSRWNDYVWH